MGMYEMRPPGWRRYYGEGPCPSCGHCPTCGRGGWAGPIWINPYWQYQWPTTTTGDVTFTYEVREPAALTSTTVTDARGRSHSE